MGAGVGDPSVNQALLATDEWWRAMSAQEADDFLERPIKGALVCSTRKS